MGMPFLALAKRKKICYNKNITWIFRGWVMKHSRSTYIKNILFPCFVFSVITGIFTGILIFLFKAASSFLFEASEEIYGYVRANPRWLPLLIVGASLLGLLSALILKHAENCRGGGIPTSVALLRGLIEFRWLKSIFFLFATASMTFLGGIPLGNEGPSVQMGTAVGRGTVRVFAKNNMAWDRYIMTGGACGGFAAATGAPLTGIFFAFEEAHRRFSPMLFMTAAMTVTSSTAVMRLLCNLSGLSADLFDFPLLPALPLQYLWVALVIGLVCGVVAVAFTNLYGVVGDFLSKTLKSLPFPVKIISVFVLTSLVGFASAGFIGSGHDIITQLTEGWGIWYWMLLYFCVRAIFLMFANQVGVSGGLFVPSLTFGALIGALFAQLTVRLGVLPREYFAVPIIIGMASFLAASSRTPITTVTFALEALSGISNILPVALGVTFSFLVIETWGVTSLQERVINQKVADFNRGKPSTVVDTTVTVAPGAFAVGKEPRDILWPPTCTVLSVKKPDDAKSTHAGGVMNGGDILHIHYQTRDPESTARAIEAIVGTQPEYNGHATTRTVDEKNHIVPEI